MIEYLKIETPFVRAEDGSKKLIEGKYRNETIKFVKDLPWVWTEKIDGTNISVVWDGHNVELHGRTERAQIPAHLVNRLNDLFMTPEAEQMFEQKFGEKHVILFGEGYGLKIQNGGAYISDHCDFILFDVYFPEADLWLERENCEDIAKAFGIDIVPVIFVGTIEQAVEYVKGHPKSTIGTANMEGVVGRLLKDLRDRTGKRLMTKVKVRDYE